MQKKILIGLIVLTVVLVGAFAVFTIMTNNNTNTTTNTNAANTNSGTTVTPIVQGDVVIQKSVTYKNIALAFETGIATTSYNGQTAPTGKQYVILFLKPFDTAVKDDPTTWAGSDVRLTPSGVNDVTYAPYEVSVPTAAKQRGGYFAFVTTLGQKDFSLNFGTGKTVQSFAFSL